MYIEKFASILLIKLDRSKHPLRLVWTNYISPYKFFMRIGCFGCRIFLEKN